MTKFRKNRKVAALGVTIALMTGTLVSSQLLPLFQGVNGTATSVSAETPVVEELKGVKSDLTSKFDTNVVQKLPEALDEDREISVIVKTTDDDFTLLSAFEAQSGVSRYATVSEFASSPSGIRAIGRIEDNNAAAKTVIEKTGVKIGYGAEYNVLTGGFEITLTAKDYFTVKNALAAKGFSAYISEEYAPCEAKAVTNEVSVHDTGIFKRPDGFEYDGSGMVVAVLDTGLDYTHSAFDPTLFTSDTPTMTTETIAADISNLRAAEYTPGLSAASVYQNVKVPFTYDYADRDTDVYPLNSEHGTHVSGVILGNNIGSSLNGKDDPEIMGVAPNAQLAAMKVFSDTSTGAKTSWILAALEDCVTLGVDVINMSLGTSAGFTDADKDEDARVYNQIAEHGISLVAAASNDYNSTFGSEKNGNLGLTTNPDSGTAGSPGSYSSALSVASISGVETPYLTYKGQIIYFTESSDASSEPRDFVEDILPANVDEMDFEYVTIPGIGRTGDYGTLNVKDKIALVRRGDTTFEEKARIAQRMGAAGVIIYNNVSGDISMTVGSVTTPVCSISRDNGELLASAGTGKIHVSRSQKAGPFMSDFSSWGPTPDLRIKPEITAHGGEILSAVPGQAYDRLSGTSMASPNQAGVTALVRQYVSEKVLPNGDPKEIMAAVNQIMMSTADISLNKNGLPNSVRKQGAGLANLTEATTTPAYITTFARSDSAVAAQEENRFTDEIIDKAKIEYGDDKQGTGKYELRFKINNISDSPLSYNVDAIVMTEGISEVKTARGDQTVNQEGYLLDPKTVEVRDVTGGVHDGNTVTVAGKTAATVVVYIELSDSDLQYLNQTNTAGGKVFANGMYVEGYITLAPESGTKISLNVPFLAFFGDWTQAPILDLDYFETDPDERDNAIDPDKKTMADSVPTRPIAGMYEDYITSLGSFYFIQDESASQVAADRDHISLTNQEGESGGANYIYGIYAGMLRGAKRVEMSITDSATGEVIWTKTETNQRKSYNGGGSIYSSFVDVDFHVSDYDLKNNTKYLFRMQAFMDYPGEQNNLRDTFEFEFTTDFQAPILTDVDFRVEYDRNTKQNKLYAHLYIYDNHFPMALSTGRVYYDAAQDGIYIESFSRYPTPISASRANTTSEVEIDLTNYVEKMKGSYRPNTFVVELYDYAMNLGYYEVTIPSSVRALYFNEMFNEDKTVKSEENGEYGVYLSPNQTYVLEPQFYPSTEWRETLDYESSDESVVRVVDGKLYAVGAGTATVTASSSVDESVTAELTVKVYAEDEKGWQSYDDPAASYFRLTGYTTDYAFYFVSTDDRDIGITGSRTLFSANASMYGVSMFPSEKITLQYDLAAYRPEKTKVVYFSNDERIVRVDANGQITAVSEGISSVSARVVIVREDGTEGGTLYEQVVYVTVKNPYERNGPYLFRYTGGGMETYIDEEGAAHENVVNISPLLGFTQIYQFAFSGYEFIPKDLDAGDEISEEDPSYTKIWYHGDNPDVKGVVIPEGIEVIGMHAFAGMDSLEEVWLPKSLTRIDAYAFYDCPKLMTVHGLENVKFINYYAFSGPLVEGENGAFDYNAAPLYNVTADSFASAIGIGDNAFRGTKITQVNLPKTAQSIGQYAFADSELREINITADKIKLGAYAFANCPNLNRIKVNASVIPDGVFEGDKTLGSVELGADVESIGVNAFSGTAVSNFTVAAGNQHFKQQSGSGNHPYLLSNDEDSTLVYVAPSIQGNKFTLEGVTAIAANAFSGNENLLSVTMPDVTKVGDYAFYGCSSLSAVSLGALESIGNYAFAGTKINKLPDFANSLNYIGSYAFARTALTSVDIGADIEIGEGAFFRTTALRTVTLGDGVKVGAGAFQAEAYQVELDAGSDRNYNYFALVVQANSRLTKVDIGDDVTVGEGAFSYQTKIETLTFGEGVEIGDGAFYGAADPTAKNTVSVDLSGVTRIGMSAFSGDPAYAYAERVSDGSIAGIAGVVGYQVMRIPEADLSGLTSLGAQAFLYNRSLASVTGLGDKVTVIPALAFAYTALSDFTPFENVTEIDVAAFAATSFSSLDLTNVGFIGGSAFESVSGLYDVTLKEGVIIGDNAFYGAADLFTVTNLDKAVYIGGLAFGGTALSGPVDLSSAISIGDYAFVDTAVTEAVLSENLLNAQAAAQIADFPKDENGEFLLVLGENPFAGCSGLAPFARAKSVEFNGVTVDTIEETTFDLGSQVKVIDGALYKVAPNGGLVLVCYPAGSGAREFTVADGTVRISAYAFAGAGLFSVVLPDTLLSIGDRAFVDCLNLNVVTFRSLNAPILEEQYDDSWPSSAFADWNGTVRIPCIGTNSPYIDENEEMIPGLALVPFATWNNPDPMYLYGANFKGNIGMYKPDIVMVRPSNGVGYDSFVYAQYFGQQLKGAVAISEDTRAAIKAIALIPENSLITKETAPIIERARALYDLIATAEQQALVSGAYDNFDYYNKLTSAESILASIMSESGENPETPPATQGSNNLGAVITLGVFTGVFALTTAVLAAVCAVLLVKRKKSVNVADADADAEPQDRDE